MVYLIFISIDEFVDEFKFIFWKIIQFCQSLFYNFWMESDCILFWFLDDQWFVPVIFVMFGKLDALFSRRSYRNWSSRCCWSCCWRCAGCSGTCDFTISNLLFQCFKQIKSIIRTFFSFQIKSSINTVNTTSPCFLLSHITPHHLEP